MARIDALEKTVGDQARLLKAHAKLTDALSESVTLIADSMHESFTKSDSNTQHLAKIIDKNADHLDDRVARLHAEIVVLANTVSNLHTVRFIDTYMAVRAAAKDNGQKMMHTTYRGLSLHE